MRSRPAALRALLLSPAASLAIAASPALAQPAPPSAPADGDGVAAEALFQDGRNLMNAGKYAEACPKFADSERLDPSPSTLLNLANCWEKLGRSATAWATYKAAESAASAARRTDYAATAERHAEALAARLARLTVDVASPVAGLLITRDGAVVAPAEWGTAMPVDPGTHALEASAPGYKAWASTIDVPRDGAQLRVPVPALEPAPAPAPAATPALPPSSSAPPPAASPDRTAPSTSSAPVTPSDVQPAGTDLIEPADFARKRGPILRTIGIVVGAAGLAGLGSSAILAAVAAGKNKDSLQHCPARADVCDANGVAERNDALAAGDAATAAFVVGAAALVAGVVLWVAAPSDAAAAPSPTASDRARARAFSVAFAAGPGGAALTGRW